MRILVIRDTNPFAAGNASNNRFLSLAEGLAEKECHIDIVILNGYYSREDKNKFRREGCINKINYQYIFPVNFWNRWIRNIYYRFLTSKCLLCRILRKYQIDTYDYLWIEMGIKSVKIGLNLIKNNKRKIFHERSEFSWIGFENKWKLHDKYLKVFLPSVDVFGIMTKKLISYYSKYTNPAAKILHIPMTVDFSRFENVKENNLLKPYIAYCGTMNNKKDGVDILIKAFIKIMNVYTDLHLYIAGDLKPKSDYEMQLKIIKEGKAENRIHYLGFLPRESIPEFLCNAKILALPRPLSEQAEGGFPTKLGEYLASGNPVCLTKTGEVCLYLKDGYSAFIALPGAVESFVQAMVKALSAKQLKDIGKNGRQVAKMNFNKQIQAKILFDTLNDLLQQ